MTDLPTVASTPESAYGIRNLTYGMLDSIISTTGVLAGLAHANMGRRAILVTGVILVAVEATSMSFGAALSDEHFEITDTAQSRPSPSRKWKSAVVMLLAYAITGLLLLLPYAIEADTRRATVWSVVLGAAAIFGLVARFQGAAKGAESTALGLGIMGLAMYAGRALA